MPPYRTIPSNEEPDNFNESGDLKAQIEAYYDYTGYYPESVHVDKIYEAGSTGTAIYPRRTVWLLSFQPFRKGRVHPYSSSP